MSSEPPYTETDLDLAEAGVTEALGEHDGNRTVGRHVLDALAAAHRLRMTPAELDHLMRGAYQDGKGDGRRQATAGWGREWQMEMPQPGAGWISIAESQVGIYAGLTRRSRLVGPWEPVEQAEPALSEDPVARRLGLIDAEGRVVCHCLPGQCAGHGASQVGVQHV